MSIFQPNNPHKTQTKALPPEIIEAINERITNGYTPSVAIALIDSSGTYYFNFGKTQADGKEVN